MVRASGPVPQRFVRPRMQCRNLRRGTRGSSAWRRRWGSRCRLPRASSAALAKDTHAQGQRREVKERLGGQDYHNLAFTGSQYASQLLCSSISLAGGGVGGRREGGGWRGSGGGGEEGGGAGLRTTSLYVRRCPRRREAPRGSHLRPEEGEPAPGRA